MATEVLRFIFVITLLTWILSFFSHKHRHFWFFCIVQLLIFFDWRPPACIMSSVSHRPPLVLHPSVFFPLASAPPLFRSPEQWACGGWAIRARPAVPPTPVIPPQTPSHRTAGCQRQVNMRRTDLLAATERWISWSPINERLRHERNINDSLLHTKVTAGVFTRLLLLFLT